MTPETVLDFWFAPEHKNRWFNSTPEFDAEICERFEALWLRAKAGDLDHWKSSAKGSVALAIVLDQFPLNMYRKDAIRYSTEQQAVAVARAAVAAGQDRALAQAEKAFLYMPFMHSENPADQDLSVALFEASGLEDNARFAAHHREIIRRFGRFPHRNVALGRETTAEEQAWLDSPEGFSA